MYYSLMEEDEFPNWIGYSLIMPAISVGNIGQLTCDLIINTLKLTKTGCFSDQSLQPLCGNDAFHSEGIAAGKLVTSAEVYESREKKIVVIQQRADLVQGRTSEFRRKLIDWIKESGFSKVLLLASCFAYEKTDAHIQSNTYRYLMTPSLEAKRDEFVSNLLKYSRLEKKPVEEGLELTSQQDDIPEAGRDIHLPGGGIARKLFIDWCRCGGFCRVLPSFSVGDCICCREIEEVRVEADYHDDLCITQVPSFPAAILDPVSLFIARQHFTERWRRQARSFAARNNEKYRYVAYRQFVRWCWGILGKDIRVQLPACVQSRIKTAYPDGAGEYKGTVLRQLNMN